MNKARILYRGTTVRLNPISFKTELSPQELLKPRYAGTGIVAMNFQITPHPALFRYDNASGRAGAYYISKNGYFLIRF